MLGLKSVELRSWRTEYRGRLWIHASRRTSGSPGPDHRDRDAFRGWFVGSVEFVAVVPLTPSRWELWRDKHLDPGHYVPGLLAWVVGEPRRFSVPLPAPGRLRLSQSDLRTETALRRRDAEAAAS